MQQNFSDGLSKYEIEYVSYTAMSDALAELISDDVYSADIEALINFIEQNTEDVRGEDFAA